MYRRLHWRVSKPKSPAESESSSLDGLGIDLLKNYGVRNRWWILMVSVLDCRTGLGDFCFKMSSTDMGGASDPASIKSLGCKTFPLPYSDKKVVAPEMSPRNMQLAELVLAGLSALRQTRLDGSAFHQKVVNVAFFPKYEASH